MTCSGRIFGSHRWEVLKTIWPYEEGYGVRCSCCGMVTDTGLTKEEAERRSVYNHADPPTKASEQEK